MEIKSSVFGPSELIPSKYTCEGENTNPPLEIFNVPADAQSLALIVQDPDAPGGDFVHWLIWNIDSSIREIREGIVPVGAQEGLNDSNQIGWSGPCPPSGTHHYEFHLYALKDKLDLPSTIDKESLRQEIQKALVEESTLIGLYKKM